MLVLQGFWFNPDLELLFVWCVTCSSCVCMGLSSSPVSSNLQKKPFLLIGNSKLTLCRNNVSYQEVPVSHYVHVIFFRCTITLTMAKRLLKMNKQMINLKRQHFFFTFCIPDNHHYTLQIPLRFNSTLAIIVGPHTGTSRLALALLHCDSRCFLNILRWKKRGMKVLKACGPEAAHYIFALP